MPQPRTEPPNGSPTPDSLPNRPTALGGKALAAMGVASGLLAWASFHLPLLSWIALVPLALFVRLESRRGPLYGAAYLAGLAFFLPGIAWLRYSHETSWMGWISLAGYLALYVPFALLGARVLNRRWNVPLLLAFPIAWTAAEFVRMHLFTGFGWLMIAHSHAYDLWLIQIADLGGAYLVSFLIAMVNTLFAETLTLPLMVRNTQGRPAWNRGLALRWGVTMGLLLAAVVYSGYQRATTSTEPGPKLLLLQTNDVQEIRNTDADAAYEGIIELTRRCLGRRADLVVWPETSYPFRFGPIEPGWSDTMVAERYRAFTGVAADDSMSDSAFGRLVRKIHREADVELADISDKLGMPLLIGVARQEFLETGCRQANSSVLFAPNVGEVAHYDKIHLVPFGEYLPLKEYFPWLRMLLPYPEDYNFECDPGSTDETFHHGPLHFACLICFEDTFPNLASGFLRSTSEDRPVDFFVCQCNDGWFRNSIQGDYHRASSVFRAIETRRAIVRLCNPGQPGAPSAEGLGDQLKTPTFDPRGTTCLIDSTGAVVVGLDRTRPGILEVTVPIDRRRTFYVWAGDWFAWGCLIVVLVGVLASLVRLVWLAKRRWQRGPEPRRDA